MDAVSQVLRGVCVREGGSGRSTCSFGMLLAFSESAFWEACRVVDGLFPGSVLSNPVCYGTHTLCWVWGGARERTAL